jgi:hypothetical protein
MIMTNKEIKKGFIQSQVNTLNWLKEMKTTHEKALKLFEKRKYFESHVLANQDEGLIKKFSFCEWLDYAHSIITKRNREARA